MDERTMIEGAPVLRILAASALRATLTQCAEKLAQTHGLGFDLNWGTSGAINTRVHAGEAFDLVASARGALSDLAEAGLVLKDAFAIGVSKLAMGVRMAQSAPDISSADKFRDVLLKAERISRGDPAGGGTAGNHLVKVFAQLGVTDEVGAKSVLRAGGFAVMKEVLEGRADFGLTQSTEIPAVEGVKIGAFLPDDVQLATVYAIAATPAAQDETKIVLDFLRGAEAAQIVAKAGFAPA